MADLNRRQTAINALREAERFVEGNDFANAPIERLKVTLANVRRISGNSIEIHDRLIGAHIPQAEYDQHEILRTEIQDLVNNLETKLLVQMGILGQRAAAQNVQEMRYLLTQKIENTWGEFDGTLSKWKAFRDMFISAVHESEYMTNVFKFQQLKRSLKGEAAEVLEGWEISSDNYPLAWARLNTVFNLPHQTVTQLIDKLRALPKIEKANRKQLQHLSNVTNSVRLQLEGSGHNMEHCDIMFLATLENKLDRFTRREWEMNRADEPTLAQFLTFVERQARSLPDVASETDKQSDLSDLSDSSDPCDSSGSIDDEINYLSLPHKKLRFEKTSKTEVKREEKRKGMNFNVKCPMKGCGLSHFLFRCPKYLALNLGRRELILKDNRLCVNCLSPRHFVKCCPKDGCPRCDDEKHNSTICPGNPFLSKI